MTDYTPELYQEREDLSETARQLIDEINAYYDEIDARNSQPAEVDDAPAPPNEQKLFQDVELTRSWVTRAACKGMGELFTPPTKDGDLVKLPADQLRGRRQEQAKVCAGCIVGHLCDSNVAMKQRKRR